jgi:hypothetical protein
MSTAREVIMACAAGSTWGTAVSCNTASSAFFATDVTNFVAVPEELPDESVGFNYLEYIDAGNVIVEPVLRGHLRYTTALWRLLAWAIGDDSAALVSGSDYDHTMDIQATTSLFGTLCAYDGVVVREIPSFQPNGFTLSGESGQFWQYEVRGRGDNILVSSQTNTTLSSATHVSNTLRAPFGASTIRINDQSGSSLASGDTVYLNAFSFNFQRAQVGEFLSNAVAEGSGEFRTRQPAEDGRPTIEITMRFPEYSAITYMQDVGDETFKKMDLTITGPTTASANNYTITLSFPALRVVNVEHTISNGNRIVESLTLRGLSPQSAPSGMTGITFPFRLILRDATSAAYDT